MTHFFQRLTLRERWLVGSTLLFLGAVLTYVLVLDPLLAREQRYSRLSQSKRQDLILFRELAAEYKTLQATLKDLEERVSARGPRTSLLAAMEGEARKLGLADNIASMKPFTSELESGMVQSSVEVRLEKVDLKGLVEFIDAVENGAQMAVTTRLRIKTRFDDPQLLDTTMLVSTLEAP